MKRLILFFILLSNLSFGQFTKPELYQNINDNVRLKSYSPLRISAVLDSIVATMNTGGNSSYTFTNGLTESGGAVKWGGSLTENTTIDGAGLSLSFGDVEPDALDTYYIGATNFIWQGSQINFRNVNDGAFENEFLSDQNNWSLLVKNDTDRYAGWYVSADGVYSVAGIYSLNGLTQRELIFDNSGTTLNIGSDATNDMYYRNSSGYLSRIAAGTNGYVLTSNSGVPTWAAPSGGGGSGTVNSGTQYRLGYYAATGTAISEAAAITANRALISDANGVPTHSSVTATELGYSSGLTSSAQTQLNSKLNLAGDTYTTTTGNGLALTSSTLTSGTLVDITATGTAAASNTKKALNVSTSGANATSTQTTYGGYFSNTSTGTSSTNIGLYATATGGTSNLAASFNGGGRWQTGATGGDIDFLTSGATNWIRFSNSGLIYFRPTVNTNNRLTPQTNGVEFYSPGGAPSGAVSRYNFLPSSAITITSGTDVLMALGRDQAGTKIGATLSSGTTTFKTLELSGTYNMTGTYSGTLINLDIDPTMTSTTGLNHIAIRTTSGKMLLGGTSITSSTSYDFRGVGSGSDRILRLANASNTEIANYRESGEYYHTNSTTGTYKERHITGGGSVTTFSENIYSGSDFANGEAVTLEVLWVVKDESANTSAGGVFYTTWSKDGGAIAKAGDNQLVTNNNTGDTFTLSTADSSGNIQITISSTGSSGNWKGTAMVKSITKL